MGDNPTAAGFWPLGSDRESLGSDSHLRQRGRGHVRGIRRSGLLFIPILILLGVNAFVVVDRQGDDDVSASPGTTTTTLATTTSGPTTVPSATTTTTTTGTPTTTGPSATTTTTAGDTGGGGGGTGQHPNTGWAIGLAPGVVLIGAGLALGRLVRRRR